MRRADDWLRSGHNSTVWASDAPPYEGTPTIVAAVRRVAKRSTPELSAVDHEGAYRNFPVRSPAECATVLPEEGDERVWLHQVLPFGSSGSVWSYIRFADAVCFLSVALLMLAAAHFVDDFFKVESSVTSRPRVRFVPEATSHHWNEDERDQGETTVEHSDLVRS